MSTLSSSISNQSHASSTRLSLLPFALFLVIFIGCGWYFSYQGVDYAFYQVPASIAILPAIFLALMLGKASFEQKIEQFITGIGHPNIIAMCLIYLLAGAFASIAKVSGSMDASVQLLLSLFPAEALLPALFIVAAIVATAMGTSMGTIAAIAPIAASIAATAELSQGLVAGAVLSGAIFGDNLSVISDTTIAATRSQGASMRDKLITNARIALPSALITLLILSYWPISAKLPELSASFDLIALLPYLMVLGLALSGVNVFIVLTLAIIFTAMLAFSIYNIAPLTLVKAINTGFSNMQDIMLLSLLIGGLSELIKQQGGIHYLISTIHRWQTKLNKKSKNTPVTIALLTFVTNFFTANNTVSIILLGDSVKQLAKNDKLSASNSASLLDIFACINQGLLPYGAQALLLAASFKLAPTNIICYAIYPLVLAIMSLIFFNRQYRH